MINHEEWTEVEDRKILEEFEKGGARWAIIAKMLNNRSVLFYNSIFRKIK